MVLQRRWYCSLIRPLLEWFPFYAFPLMMTVTFETMRSLRVEVHSVDSQIWLTHQRRPNDFNTMIVVLGRQSSIINYILIRFFVCPLI